MANELTQLKEIIELREVDKKVFLVSDGSYKEIYYPMAIHEFDSESGKYIDKTSLALTENDELILGDVNQSGLCLELRSSYNTDEFNIVVGKVYTNGTPKEYIPEIKINLQSFLDKKHTAKKITLDLDGAKMGNLSSQTKVRLLENFFGEFYDYSKINASKVEYDITKAVLQALRLNHDMIEFKLSSDDITDVSIPNTGTAKILSGYNVTLSVEYETSHIIKTSGSVHSHDIGRFGSGYIDIVNGNLCFECEDFAWNGNKMPVTLKHLYNSELFDAVYTGSSTPHIIAADFSNMKLGYGWRLDIMQSIVKIDNSYIYVDGYGNETVLTLNDKNIHENTEQGLAYDESTQILSMGDEEYKFSEGRLVSLTDSYKNTMLINYENGKIITVTDGAGRTFTFGYDKNNYLSSITAPDNTAVTYEYINGYLSKITYPDGRYATLLETEEDSEYINEYMILNLYGANGNSIKNIQYEMNGRRLKGIYSNGITTFYDFYPENKSTSISVIQSQKTKEYTYIYDGDGNKISEYFLKDKEIIEVESSHGLDPYSECIGIVNKAENLITGHNLSDVSQWELSQEYAFETINTDKSCKFGNTCIKFSNESGEGNDVATYCRPELNRGNYTYSGYIKIANKKTEDFGVSISVCNGNSKEIGRSEKISILSDDYIRVSVNFELEEDSILADNTAPYIKIHLYGMGTAYINGLQLEKNSSPTEYNHIDLSGNSSFVNGVATISGNLDSAKTASVPVNIKTEKGIRENFTLSCMGKIENNLPAHQRDGLNLNTFRLRAVINYVKDKNEEIAETEEFIADFNHNIESWQYASVDIEKSKFKEIDKLEVFCDYDYNVGTAYFDNLRLVRNSIETDLTEEDFNSDDAETENEDVGTGAIDNPSAETENSDEAMDKFGNPITETAYTEGEFGTIYRSFGYNTEFDEDLVYDEQKSGNDLIYETDSRGGVTTYCVDSVHSRNHSVIDRMRNCTAYEYDVNGKVSKIINRDSCRKELSKVSYAYDGLDNLSDIQRKDGMGYSLSYNNFSQLLNIGVKGVETPLVSYTYKNAGGKLDKITYANGDYMTAVYNDYGQLTAEHWYDSKGYETAHYKYAYDSEGNIIRSIDILSQREYNYLYSEGNLVSAKEFGITVTNEGFITNKTLFNDTRFFFDGEGNLTKKTVIFEDGKEHTTVYEYTEDGKQTVKFEADGLTVSTLSKTDHFGRKVFDEVQTSVANVSREFEYVKGKVTKEHKQYKKVKSLPTTNLVSKITFADGRTIEYEYDKEERITKVIDSVDGETKYTYDGLGQLLSEYRKKKGEHFFEAVNIMTYDNYGNILTKNGVNYCYDSVWKDKIISAGGLDISYDRQGNPIDYFGNKLVWEKGRQLKSFNLLSFKYNANGIRTSKIVNGIEHKYVLEGTKILKEYWDYDAENNKYKNVLIPLYDNEDNVCGIKYNDTAYYFIKNLQNDVIAIVDKNGNQVARYTYDAWGMLTDFYSDKSNIGYINPFRYRSYYYDSEIDLYYLQSRYYDPRGGRFLNADMPEFGMIEQGALAHNLFAYCGNDCVNEDDLTGKALIKFLALGIQLAFSIGKLDLGFEFLWDLKNGSFYPFIFIGGGKSISSAKGTNYVTKYLLNPLKNIKKTSTAILNALGKSSISVSAIVVFGNSKQKMPNDYRGWFNNFSTVLKIWLLNVAFAGAFARNSKGYIASLSIGLSSSCSISFGKTYYIQLNASLKKQLNKLFEPLRKMAKSVQNKIQNTVRILF